MKILFKFASRSRPLKLLAGLANIKHNVISNDYLILVSLDKDDASCKDLKSGNNVKVIYGDSTGKVDAINRDLDGLKYNWDILVNFSDDMHFNIMGFDEIIRDDMSMYFPDTDGVLHYWDGGKYKDKLMTMSIIGRKYYERDNYIYHPEYNSLWCDNEAMEVAQLRGKLKYIPRILFNHLHPAWGTAENDDLYRLNESFYTKDSAVYAKRKFNNFFI